MANVPIQAADLSSLGAGDLQAQAWSRKLQEESVLFDVFEDLAMGLDTQMSKKSVPDSIFLKFEKPITGVNQFTIGLLKSLEAEPQQGNAQNMLGNEEDIRLKHITVFYNEIKKSVASLGWGIDANNINYYQAYKEITPLVANYFQELRGKRIREALILRFEESLTENPVGKVQQFNPNWFIAGLPLGDQPGIQSASNPWDPTALTVTPGAYPNSDAFEDNFGQVLAAALRDATTDGASPEDSKADVTALHALEHFCEQRLLLEPIMLDGEPTYIFVIPQNQAIILKDPTRTKSMGSVWKDVSCFTERVQNIPGVLGRVGKLLICEDARYPTLTLGNVADPANLTITPGFQQPGRNDGRNHGAYVQTNNEVYDIGFVLGKAALIEWIVDPLRYATETTEYGKFVGRGAYELSGIQIGVYDQDTPDATSIQNDSSCVVAFARQDLTANA